MRHKMPKIPRFTVAKVEEKPRSRDFVPPPWDHEVVDHKGNVIHLMRTEILGQRIVFTVEEQLTALRKFAGAEMSPVSNSPGDRGFTVHATKEWHETGFGKIIGYMGTYQFSPKEGEVVPPKVLGTKSDPHAVPHIFFLCEEYDARKAAKRTAKRTTAATGLQFANPLTA